MTGLVPVTINPQYVVIKLHHNISDIKKRPVFRVTVTASELI